jgi:predicted Abi (CAAX) family protease
LKTLLARSLRALRTPPGPRGWLETAVGIAGVYLLLGPALLASGLLRYDPRPWLEALLVIAIALPIPAICEEFVFRGPIPSRGETGRPILWILASTLVFSSWHVVQARVFAGAEVFMRPDFLAATLVIGGVCGVLRYRTGSLWPPILLHWIAPSTWLSLFGGPSLARLLGQ